MRAVRFLAMALVLLLAVSCISRVEVVGDFDDGTTGGEPTGNDSAAAVPAPTDAPERSSEQQSASEQSEQPAQPEQPEQPAQPEPTATAAAPEVVIRIDEVDFENGFTYDTLLDFGPGTATVTNGDVENGAFGDDEFYWFGAQLGAVGDLDGDGVEEAAVITTWNGGGTGYFDSVRVYRLVDGQAVRVGVVVFGDRADGGVHQVGIKDGLVQVLAYAGGEGTCCPNKMVQSNLLLGDHSLVQLAHGPIQTWLSLDTTITDREIKFLPGTSTALLTTRLGQDQTTATFEGNAGQRLRVRPAAGPGPTAVTVHDLTTNEVIVDADDIDLPSTGLYELTLSFSADRTALSVIEFSIDADDSVAPVQWTPDIEQVLLDDEPFVHTSVTWPIFSADQPGVDAANDAVAAYATALDDWWVADVTEFEDPEDDSSYDVAFEVTLTTADLASVHFVYFDYVCCRPYPNYGHGSAVVDLAAGRLIPIDEILDLSRIAEINELWLAELVAQGQIPSDAVAGIVEGEATVRFDSLTLRPEGIEFGTDRASLGGGLSGTQTIVSYDQLGDLVAADLLARIDGTY